mgnify:CR=1 FL=1
MALTVLQCEQWIRLTLGGSPDPVLSTLQLVNMTGKHFVSMTSWRYLEGVEATLDTVLSQTWLALPANFKSPIALYGATSNAAIEWTTREALNEMRAQSTPAGTGGYTYAVVETVAATGSTPPTTRLAIFPPSSTTASAVYRMVYRAGWANLTADATYVPIPVWGENLFETLLMAFARGLQREEQGSTDKRLEEIARGRIFRNALHDDRTKQPEHGRIQGAIAQRRRRWRVWPFSGHSTGP